MRLAIVTFTLSVAVVGFTGCSSSSTDEAAATAVPAASLDGSKYLLAEEPDGAMGVIAARESAKDGDPVVIVGRIGGSDNPWIEGRAAFMLLDASKLMVAIGEDLGEEEICMDDCCAAERADCTTLVKVVDADGKLVAADSRQLLGLTSDDMVVVRGKAKKDDSDNFTVLADAVYIRR